MRDLNEDSNSCSWPLYYGDKTLTNGQYYNSFFPRANIDAYPGYDKDVLKRTMLEHEAIFKNQVIRSPQFVCLYLILFYMSLNWHVSMKLSVACLYTPLCFVDI